MIGRCNLCAAALAAMAAAAHADVDVSFARGRWNAADFTPAKCARLSYLGTFDQLDDAIVNRCPEGASAEDVFTKHNDGVYAALVHKTRFSLGATVAATMAWDWRMAPLVVIAPELGADAQGRAEFREHWEIVLFDDGVNVWHHFYRDGRQSWIKAAGLKLPPALKFKANDRHTMSVRVERKKNGHKAMIVTVEGYVLEYVDDALPETFLAGLVACEGRNFFYDFKVTEK